MLNAQFVRLGHFRILSSNSYGYGSGPVPGERREQETCDRAPGLGLSSQNMVGPRRQSGQGTGVILVVKELGFLNESSVEALYLGQYVPLDAHEHTLPSLSQNLDKSWTTDTNYNQVCPLYYTGHAV